MPSGGNTAIIAVAGARKTETVIEQALEDRTKRTLITTYTTENLRQIISRIQAREGILPPHLSVAGWFTFLLRDAIRPYQYSAFGEVGIVRGLNFEGSRNRYASKAQRSYFLDRNNDVFRDGMADLACTINEGSGGRVIERLEQVYDRILIDEVQDLVGYDLDFLDLLFKSKAEVTVVGDPRQHILDTNLGPRNRKYRGAGFAQWLDERVAYCQREDRNLSARCEQGICDFASAIFPELPALVAEFACDEEHRGIHLIEPHQVHEYVARYEPMILRHSRITDTFGQPAMNIGLAKGSTFDRVLVFPTNPMKQYLRDRDPVALSAPERLYVAVTRARYSVAFVL